MAACRVQTRVPAEVPVSSQQWLLAQGFCESSSSSARQQESSSDSRAENLFFFKPKKGLLLDSLLAGKIYHQFQL